MMRAIATNDPPHLPIPARRRPSHQLPIGLGAGTLLGMAGVANGAITGGYEMNELTSRVEEIARAMQDSYQADIDLMTRRDKAHLVRIAYLEQICRVLEKANSALRQRIAELEAQLAAANAWRTVEDDEV